MSKAIEVIILMLMLLTIVAASRPFNLILTKLVCTADVPEYVKAAECKLTNIGSKSYAEGFMIFAQDIKEMDVGARSDIVRPVGPPLILFDLLLDGCELLQKTDSNNIVKLTLDFLRKAGHLPEKCPIPANENFTVSKSYVAPDILPMYTPDFNFSLKFTYLVKSQKVATILIIGRTETKRKSIFKNKEK